MGRFELVAGEDHEGAPVYRQAHSKEIPSVHQYHLYRSDKFLTFVVNPSRRCGDHWLVGEYGESASLRASAGLNPKQPPCSGWEFFNLGADMFETDPGFSCSPNVKLAACCLAVSLSGPAKEAHGRCEGKYKSTGLMSMGRPVICIKQTLVIV